MRRTLLLILVPLALAAQTAPADLCTMQGKVVNAVSGEPVRKAVVTMTPADMRPGQAQVPTTYTTTDADGRFALIQLEPGRYRVSVSRSGFVQGEYGARRVSGPSATLTLEKGAQLNGIDVSLTPHGVVTGRVTNELGEPALGALVAVSRYSYARGKPQLVAVGSAMADDLGDYRVFGLPPGRYVVSAGFRQPNYSDGQDRSAKPRIEEDYSTTYYPGTPDQSAAKTVDVTAGGVTTGLQLRLMKTRTYRVSGHATQSIVTGRPTGFNVSLVPKGGGPMVSRNVRSARVDAKGSFTITGVFPGKYDLNVITIVDSQQRALRVPVDVTGDVEDINVGVRPGLTLNGSFKVEGEATPALKGLRIDLRPRDSSINFMRSTQYRLKDDLSFSLENVDPDLYDVNVPLPDGFYLKSIRYGEADPLVAGLDLTRSASEPLQIALGTNPGQVSGQTAVGATVALVPTEPARRAVALYYRNATTDQSGKFSFRNLAPGEYRLFAWEDVEDTAWLDPEFLKPIEDKGHSITVRESGRQEVQLTAIPVQDPAKRK